MAAYFDISLDIPHAARVMIRWIRILDRDYDAMNPHRMRVFVLGGKILELLLPFHDADDNPPPEIAEQVRRQAAQFGRRLVVEMETADVRSDRLGQLIRNFFECLALGEEGARLSLRAGENPDSLQRPT